MDSHSSGIKQSAKISSSHQIVPPPKPPRTYEVAHVPLSTEEDRVLASASRWNNRINSTSNQPLIPRSISDYRVIDEGHHLKIRKSKTDSIHHSPGIIFISIPFLTKLIYGMQK